ncbi:MAG: NAD+ synthase [Candidatus Aceula meridiana]|nr:NAD+ synthase [Candidatus Aceula meridiana]
MKNIRIALAQINTTVGDLNGNAEKIVSAIQKARAMSSDVVVFPELSITGYPPEDLLLKKHFIDDNLATLKTVTPHTKNITVVIGFVDRDSQKSLFNAAAVIANGKLKSVYRKNNLPNYGVFDEKRYFQKGEKVKIFSCDGISLGISICEDIWSDNGPCMLQAKAGAQILLNLSASPYHLGKMKQREKVLSACAKKLKATVCYCNLVGGQDELIFDGGSFFVDPKGKTFATGKQFEEDLIVADIAVSPKASKGKGVEKIRVEKNFKTKAGIFIKGRVHKHLKTEEEIYQALVLGTRDYLYKNGFKKAVIGISGGIDSALVAAIARDALGAKNVLGVSMPSPYTSSGTKKDAKRLAQNLGIEFMELSIKSIFAEYLKILKTIFGKTPSDVAEQNLQARIRGNILMAISNKHGHLVLTTGNKSETAVGYCTLYGDMAGGFAVIKDIPKTRVYKLVEFRNKKGKKAVIPQSIIKRAPTAELKKNQKDQDSLPAYDVLDAILAAYVEGDQAIGKFLKDKKARSLVKKTVDLVDHMEYKRRQAPLGIKISPKAFGKDRRLPITNKYREK